MADGAKTGNALLDAWIDAVKPVMPAVNPFGGFGTASQREPSPFSWERMFLGDWSASPVAGAFAPASAARLSEAWSDLAQRSFGVISALGNTSNAGDPLGEALEQSFGVMGDVGGAAGEGPALLAEATKAASVLLAAREAYRAFMLATWQRVFEEVTREAVQRTNEGKPVTTPAQWLSFSNAVADRVFVEAFHSAAYVELQRRLSSALADQRRTEIKFVEVFARLGHFPTRRALEDVSREVSELRRRVRKLERESRTASSATAAPTASAASSATAAPIAPERRRKREAGDGR